MGIGAAIGGIVSGIGSLGGGIFGASAADKAAKAQQAAAAASLAETQRQYNQNRADLQPYRDIGQNAGNMLTAQLPDLTAPWQPTQANLEATPGYQFTLGQGLKSTQNSAAARGLGLSGAALKGAAGYATGLADNTWQNVFNADQTQKTNAFNKLLSTTNLGASAAGAGVTAGNATTAMGNNALMAGGNASAAGTVAGASALTNGLNGATNNLLMYGMMNSKNGGGGFGGLFSNPEDSALLSGAGGLNSGNGWSLFG